MIYTITFSPSIDYVINHKNKFNENNLNRIENFKLVPGGKGINASIILNRIGFKNKAITFLGGPTKNLFLELIENEKVELINFSSNDCTRINVKMFASNTSFEINGPKTSILEYQYQNLIEFIKTLNENDFVFIMGICDENYLEQIVINLSSRKVQFALDVDSKKVVELLKYEPIIIKPNRQELSLLIDYDIKSINDIKKGMKFLLDKGLQNILVSDGPNGSYFLDKKRNFYHIKLKKDFQIISTIGAGDTLISSFITLYLKTNNLINSLKQATSLSIGTACSYFLANSDDMNKYVEDIEVIKL